MTKQTLAGIIVACVVAIIAVTALVIFHPWRPSVIPPPMYSLSLNVAPSGAGLVSPPGDQYAPGANVTLTAIPASGYTFDYWGGAASGTSPSITITMDSDKSVTANFNTVPSVTIALDFFGLKDTGRLIGQIGAESNARIQLVVFIRDAEGSLDAFSIPEEGVGDLPMDFFQVIALSDHMDDPTIFTGTPADTLTVSIAAYNTNKGPVTKAQIDLLSTWTGTDLSVLKSLVQDRELVGSCWHTWSASDNFGSGSNYALDDGNLKVWLRIGSGQSMPDPVTRPVLQPNVEIVGKLPTGVRVRQPSEWPLPNTWSFEFTVENHESFEFPIYWRLETDSAPRTDCGFYGVSRIEGDLTVSGQGSTTQLYRYWFETPGNYSWRYLAEYPRGNPIASWEGTLTVSP